MKGRARITHIERSDKHPQLRWVRFDVNGDDPFSLWDQVYEGELYLGQLVEFEAAPVDGRSFKKITAIRPVKGGRKPKAKAQAPKQADAQAQEPNAQPKADGFSKSEIGLMASVALKVAAKLTVDPEDLDGLFKKANVIYAWLADKRRAEYQAES